MPSLPTTVEGYTIRPAVSADVPLILAFIRQLAAYEKKTDEVQASETDLGTWLFGPSPRAEVVFGEFQGDPVGFALYFYNFSTFLGQPGLYLEDLFVQQQHRGRGFGKALMAYLARLARNRGCARFEWSVLGWNAPAIGFYKKLGAVPKDEWDLYQITGAALEALAS